MTNYFFDYADEDGSVPDQVGTELETAEDALAMAIETLCDMARDRRWNRSQEPLVMTVKDASGRCLYMVQNVTSWSRPTL
jgi:hypothetical protein